MLTPTAPKPILLLTEPTGADSLTTRNIETVFGRPSKEDITAWLKAEKKLKGKELEAAINDPATETEMTGIVYDVPRLDVFTPATFKESLDFLKGPEGRKFDTAIVDSASQLSKMRLDHHLPSQKDPRRAYKKAATEVLSDFDALLNLPMNVVFLVHAWEKQVNMGSKDEPTWVSFWHPSFEGNELKREITHKIGEIYQADTEIGDDGKPKYFLRTAAETVYGAERSRCAILQAKEEPNLTDIFGKLRSA